MTGCCAFLIYQTVGCLRRVAMKPTMLRSKRNAPSKRRPAGWPMSRKGGSVGGVVETFFVVPSDVDVGVGTGVEATDDCAGVLLWWPARTGVPCCACGSWVRLRPAETWVVPLLLLAIGANPDDAVPPPGWKPARLDRIKMTAIAAASVLTARTLRRSIERGTRRRCAGRGSGCGRVAGVCEIPAGSVKERGSG